MSEGRWQSIWRRKGADFGDIAVLALEDLIRANGFDSGAGDHGVESWTKFVGSIYQRLEIKQDVSLLEVGCGSGAFLYPAYLEGAVVCGIDYSATLLALAGRVMPRGRFEEGEANSLPVEDGAFDRVISHSVFQYFPSLGYAEQVLAEMQRALTHRGGQIAILDVNDHSREQVFYELRQAQLKGEDYQTRYDGLPHQFYEKDWFREQLTSAGFLVDIVDQDIPEYGNSAFRFNVFARAAC